MAAYPKAECDLIYVEKMWNDFRAGKGILCPRESCRDGIVALAVMEDPALNAVYRFRCSHCAWESLCFIATETGIGSFGALPTMPPRPRPRRAF